MNRRAIAAIVRKDLLVVRRSRAVLLPLIIVPAILLVLLPALAALSPLLLPPEELAEMRTLVDQMPAGLRASMAGLDPHQQVVYLVLNYLLAPLYLLIPVLVASVIAADSFAGEKERRTLEALLYTPTTDRELLLAKMLGPWIAGVAVAWLGFAVYALVANLAAWPVMGRVFFPSPVWWVLALWVAPAVAGLGLGATVLVSARVRTFQEAYQLGGLVVLPLVLLMVGQAAGVVFLSPGLVVAIGAAIWAVDALVLATGMRRFRRSEILTRL